MLGHIATNLFKTREGRIAVGASILYEATGLIATYVPDAIPLSGFYAWFRLFMPIPLALVFLQIEGFKKNFQSGWLNTGVIIVAALMPILASLKARFF